VLTLELESVVAQLKQKYQEIYATEFSTGAVFIWRPLSHYEYQGIMFSEEFSNEEKEHAICDICVLYSVINEVQYAYKKYDFSCGLAGYATKLSEEILTVSGYADDILDLINNGREQMEVFDNQIPCIIKMAFGDEIKFEDMNNWSMRKLIYYFARAEWMLKAQASINVGNMLQFVDNKPKLPKPKIPREVHEKIKWKEISEDEFLRLHKPEEHIDPLSNPEDFILNQE
jgi:hypothetical protein